MQGLGSEVYLHTPHNLIVLIYIPTTPPILGPTPIIWFVTSCRPNKSLRLRPKGKMVFNYNYHTKVSKYQGKIYVILCSLSTLPNVNETLLTSFTR